MALTTFSAGQTIKAAEMNANFALCVLTDTARTISVTHTWAASQTFTGGASFGAAITYGGVTLSNSVTGTGSMALSASPTFTGTVATSALTAAGLITANLGLTVANGGMIVSAGNTVTLTGATIAGAPTWSNAQTIPGITIGANTLALASSTVSGTPTWSSSQAITLSTAAQPNVTSLGTLTSLTMGGTLTMGANTLALAGATVSGTPTWSSSQAITLSTAAQPNITSVGTLTSLTLGGALTYGGVTLSNSVTGTGSMALSAGPTFTGTLSAANLQPSGKIAFGGATVAGTPSWASGWAVLAGAADNVHSLAMADTSGNGAYLSDGAYFNGSAWKYARTQAVSQYGQASGSMFMRVAASGTAGTDITWTTAISIASSGLVQFGGTTSSFPALKRSSADLLVRLADDSAYGTLWAADLNATSNVRIYAAAAVALSTELVLGNGTASTVGAAGGASALPATPLGYLRFNLGGTAIKVPYYNN